MPVVTVDPSDFVRRDLKSAPDGFVMLRPLPYGMKLTRRDKATRMMMKAEAPKGGRGAAEKSTIELETYSEWATLFDFAYCIGEHNLENSDGSLLDFTKPLTLKFLNPKVGSELEKYINELNEDEDEESMEDFHQRLATSLEEPQIQFDSDSPEPPNEVTHVSLQQT